MDSKYKPRQTSNLADTRVSIANLHSNVGILFVFVGGFEKISQVETQLDYLGRLFVVFDRICER